jgi:IS30 family transposase
MRTYHQLTSEERYALATLRRQGYSVRGIAQALDRAPSTISREVRRNRRKDGR